MRFTPAVKYGGRENWPSRRKTRCMSGHPCRAHHKLKWARKGQAVSGVLYEPLSRSESSNATSAANRLFSKSSAAHQTPQGQPCSTGVGNNPLTVTKPSQCTVSRMPQARRSRLSLTRCADWATLPLHMSVTSAFKEQQINNRARPRRFPKLQWVNPF